MHPKARQRGLTMKVFPEQTLIHEPSTDRVYYLGPVAASVFVYANGQRSVNEIAAKVAEDTKLKLSVDAVKVALEKLGKQGLLEKKLEQKPVSLGRRLLLRRMAAAVAVTVILGPKATWAGAC